MTTSTRMRFAAFAAALVPMGLATKVYAGPGSEWVVGNLGGAVYVAFWSFLVLAVRPSASAARVALLVLACTSALEILQLWHPPPLQAARATLAGQLVLGSSFSWLDFPYYLAGALAVVPLARLVRIETVGSGTP